MRFFLLVTYLVLLSSQCSWGWDMSTPRRGFNNGDVITYFGTKTVNFDLSEEKADGSVLSNITAYLRRHSRDRFADLDLTAYTQFFGLTISQPTQIFAISERATTDKTADLSVAVVAFLPTSLTPYPLMTWTIDLFSISTNQNIGKIQGSAADLDQPRIANQLLAPDANLHTRSRSPKMTIQISYDKTLQLIRALKTAGLLLRDVRANLTLSDGSLTSVEIPLRDIYPLLNLKYTNPLAFGVDRVVHFCKELLRGRPDPTK